MITQSASLSVPDQTRPACDRVTEGKEGSCLPSFCLRNAITIYLLNVSCWGFFCYLVLRVWANEKLNNSLLFELLPVNRVDFKSLKELDLHFMMLPFQGGRRRLMRLRMFVCSGSARWWGLIRAVWPVECCSLADSWELKWGINLGASQPWPNYLFLSLSATHCFSVAVWWRRINCLT